MKEHEFNFEIDVLVGKLRDIFKRRINICLETGEALPGHWNPGMMMQQLDIKLQLPAGKLPALESIGINHGG